MTNRTLRFWRTVKRLLWRKAARTHYWLRDDNIMDMPRRPTLSWMWQGTGIELTVGGDRIGHRSGELEIVGFEVFDWAAYEKTFGRDFDGTLFDVAEVVEDRTDDLLHEIGEFLDDEDRYAKLSQCNGWNKW